MASDGPSESDQGKPKTTPPNARVACNAGVITGIGEILFLPAVVWVGASVAAGVLGNAAYDAVKAALGRVRRRETATPPPDLDLVRLARVALDLASSQPGLAKLHDGEAFVSCKESTDGWRVIFHFHSDDDAVVWLSVEDGREDVKASVRLPRTGGVQRNEGQVDEEALRVLRAANGLDALPPE